MPWHRMSVESDGLTQTTMLFRVRVFKTGPVLDVGQVIDCADMREAVDVFNMVRAMHKEAIAERCLVEGGPWLWFSMREMAEETVDLKRRPEMTKVIVAGIRRRVTKL